MILTIGTGAASAVAGWRVRTRPAHTGGAATLPDRPSSGLTLQAAMRRRVFGGSAGRQTTGGLLIGGRFAFPVSVFATTGFTPRIALARVAGSCRMVILGKSSTGLPNDRAGGRAAVPFGMGAAHG